MKFFLCLTIIYIVLILKSNGKILNTNNNYKEGVSCYKCLDENDICSKFINDKEYNGSGSNKIKLECKDGLNCVSNVFMPSMHPNRTSSCYKSAKLYEFCDIGRDEQCSLGLWCDSISNSNGMPTCNGLRSLQYNENCLIDEQCESRQCDRKTLKCAETQYSCRVNHYWNGNSCIEISKRGGTCKEDSHCSILDTCNFGKCIKKYSIKKSDSCNSDSSCDISNSLTCSNKGNCVEYILSNSNNCSTNGDCNKELEYCDCQRGKCVPFKIINSECKNVEKKLNLCAKDRCKFTEGYVSPNSCIMKKCGKFICEYHSNCTNKPCGNNEIAYCESKDNYEPNNSLEGDDDDSSNQINENKQNNSLSVSSCLYINKIILASIMIFNLILINK